MTTKSSQIKTNIHRVFLVTEEAINSFPFHDPDNPKAGYRFLENCTDEGWPYLIVDGDVYVFATKGKAK